MFLNVRKGKTEIKIQHKPTKHVKSTLTMLSMCPCHLTGPHTLNNPYLRTDDLKIIHGIKTTHLLGEQKMATSSL